MEAIRARAENIHILIAAPEGMGGSLEFIGIASRPVEANIFPTETYSELFSVTDRLLGAMCNGNFRFF